MKKHFILLMLAFATMSACKKGDQNSVSGLFGRWKLTEQLIDPGDASGNWQKVQGDQYVTFNADGTIKGDYLLNAKRFTIIDSVTLSVSPQMDNTQAVQWRYKIKGKNLEINPPCFEPCGFRLVKH
ncbi:hypothetical protein [uncultured Mucilaginibacter sp.]|uniref:hypothetical protein n=1 Tax=uncultured Mucilaginibacter sp. TaxID=797541 RepID=UPI0025D85664|nr:hypothetical protein [uncultured Mucilaginibacter sp.]